MTLPLEGYRMLDTSRLIPGPTATWMLADLGMEVIKIEEVETRPGRARDALSGVAPARPQGLRRHQR